MLHSPAQVLTLAPDAAAAKAGAALAAARRWSTLGGDGEGRAAWGECRGSGAQPYRTAVALADLATRCTCPSRKLPCKHALGLLLLLTAEPELFAVADPPAWVAEWLAGREARAARGEARDPAPNAERAEGAEAGRRRRAGARADKTAAGMVELSRWLEDLVRAGLAAAAARPATFWDTAAARLVDAQAPGAARLVRQLAAMPAAGAGWPGRMLAAVGRLRLLAEAYGRIEALDAGPRADVRATLGWTVPAEDLGDAPAVSDDWVVLGRVVEEEQRLRVRRTWLVGRHGGRRALLLHFAHGAAPFAEPVPPAGAVLAGALTFVPGTTPRAAVQARAAGDGAAAGAPLPAGHARLADALGTWAAALAANPWTERVLLVLAAAVPDRRGGRWLVRDADGAALPLAPRFRDGWPLAALAGGRPAWIAGEWDGESLLPLAAAGADGRIAPLGHAAEASA